MVLQNLKHQNSTFQGSTQPNVSALDLYGKGKRFAERRYNYDSKSNCLC